MGKPNKNWFYYLLLSLSFMAWLLLIGGYAAPYFHADTIPLLPFLGLIYPLSLITVIVLLVFWIFIKSRWKYFSIFLLIVGIKAHFKLIGFSFFNSKDEPKALKVMSYNVRLFGLYDDASGKSKEGIFNFIREEQPDVSCFQEYYRQDKPTNFVTYDSLKNILNSVDYHERSAHNANGHRNFGIAIFSKYPMIARGDVIFENQSEYDFNYCIFADIVTQIDTIRIYNVHLQSIRLGEQSGNSLPSKLKSSYRKLRTAYAKRADQARRVIDHMQSAPYPIVVCGDFNDTPLSYTYNQFNKTLIDAFRESDWGLGATYLGKIPAGRIDYIFHTQDVVGTDFKVYNVKHSDHRPISCKIHVDHDH